MASRNACDLYTRRNEVEVSIWVVPSAAVAASSPDEKVDSFAPSADKVYRHPTFYPIPRTTCQAHLMDNDAEHAIEGNAYTALGTAEDGDHRWAFGTGFDDQLAGIDDQVPGRVLMRLALARGVFSLSAMTRRSCLSESPGWCSHAPELEDEVAQANIASDPAGPASPAADPCRTPGSIVTRQQAHPAPIPVEDACWPISAILGEFTNNLVTPPWRWRTTIDFGVAHHASVRSPPYGAWRMQSAAYMGDPLLDAIAAKAAIELTYHRDYAAGWVVRLGDGTDESHLRAQAAADGLVELLSRTQANAAPAARDAVHDDSPRCSRPRRCIRSMCRARSARGLGRGQGTTVPTWRHCWPACRASPGPTRTRHGEHAGARPSRRRLGRGPGVADAHPGRPRCAARRRGEWRAGAGGAGADLFGLPGHRRDARRCHLAPARRRLRRRAGPHRAQPAVEHWTTSPSTVVLLAENGIAPPGQAPRRAAGPVAVSIGVRVVSAVPALRVTGHRSAVGLRVDRVHGALSLP